MEINILETLKHYANCSTYRYVSSLDILRMKALITTASVSVSLSVVYNYDD